MRHTAKMVLGVVLVLIGLLWFFQGLGTIGGSSMSGNTLWAVVGPMVAIIGLVLAVQGERKRRTHS